MEFTKNRRNRLNAYFKNNLKQAILTLAGEEIKDDFQIFMLQENEIPGLLKTSMKYIDGKSHYQYDISGKVSMKVKYEKMKLSNEDIPVEITNVDYDFNPDEIVPGTYMVTFSTMGRELKVHTTRYVEEDAKVGLAFEPEDIHVMSRYGY